jgi:5'(3')-deoxyribonucleotidase
VRLTAPLARPALRSVAAGDQSSRDSIQIGPSIDQLPLLRVFGDSSTVDCVTSRCDRIKSVAQDNHERGSKPPLHFVTFVEIFFGVVLGASIVDPEIRALLFPPVFASLSFWALLAVYFTAITSWTGWHKSTIKYPYSDSRLGEVRPVVDAVIVATYGALLFFGSRISGGADEYLRGYLWGFVAVFALYYLAGVIRRTEYRTGEASRLYLIRRHGVAPLVGAGVYAALSHLSLRLPVAWLWVLVLLPLPTMISYRWFREWSELPWTRKRKDKSTIAVDMDGVLVEQVAPVLQRIRQETGLALNKCDITEWEYPLEGTNIKTEIIRAERERGFVLQMPPMEYAREALQILSKKFDIVIATSRERCTDSWSQQWLDSHGVPYENFVNTGSQGKILANADIIIDDYIENIEAFIRKGPPDRQAILFAQPWNHDTRNIADLLRSGRVRVANSWQTVLALLASGP